MEPILDLNPPHWLDATTGVLSREFYAKEMGWIRGFAFILRERMLEVERDHPDSDRTWENPAVRYGAFQALEMLCNKGARLKEETTPSDTNSRPQEE